MTNRPDSDHRSAWDAIPWVVNDRASEAQKRAVEAHAGECADCRDELVRQRALQAAMARPVSGLPDVEQGLERLRSRLDEAGRDAARAARVPARRRAGAGVLVYALAAAVLVEAVGIAALAVDRRGADAPYQTLTQAAPAAPRATLRIVPAPAMSVAELNQLLQELRLQIVGGPNEAGAYALAPLAHPPSTESQLARLRAAPGLRFAEAVKAPEPQR